MDQSTKDLRKDHISTNLSESNGSSESRGYAAVTNYAQPLAQLKTNNTGLPAQLSAGIEKMSGFSMADVKVHYNSTKPAQLQAHAYAQGGNIHLAPGQEKHLPHEAWHIVQQRQGRVQPTIDVKGEAVNDNPDLEKEADLMGAKALTAS